MTVFAILTVALFGLFFGYLIIDAIARAICEASKHRADTELKMTLAERGMSADEIERIVAARPGAALEAIPFASEEHPSERRAPSTPMPPRKSAQGPA